MAEQHPVRVPDAGSSPARLAELYQRRGELMRRKYNAPEAWTAIDAVVLERINAQLDAIEYEQMRPDLDRLEAYADALDKYAREVVAAARWARARRR